MTNTVLYCIPLKEKVLAQYELFAQETADFKFLMPLAITYNMLWFLGIFSFPIVIHLGKLELSASTFLVIMFFSLSDIITIEFLFLLNIHLIKINYASHSFHLCRFINIINSHDIFSKPAIKFMC